MNSRNEEIAHDEQTKWDLPTKLIATKNEGEQVMQNNNNLHIFVIECWYHQLMYNYQLNSYS